MASSAPDLGPDDLVYLERVRRATRRLRERRDTGDVQAALQAVKGSAHFDVEVPTSSARREVEFVKTGVKRLSVFYMRYLSAQLDAFAANLVRLGDSLAAKTDGLDLGADELAARLNALEQRLTRLETEARSWSPVSGVTPGSPSPSGTVSSSPSGTGSSRASGTGPVAPGPLSKPAPGPRPRRPRPRKP
jgi:hypothetical protein